MPSMRGDKGEVQGVLVNEVRRVDFNAIVEMPGVRVYT